MTGAYVAGGLAFRSHLGFPELANVGNTNGPVISLSVRARATDECGQGGRPVRTLVDGDGSAWLQITRTGSGFVADYPGVARFRISSDLRCVWCSHEPATGLDTIRYLWLDQVLPMMATAGGRLTLHASAVALGGGGAAFLAPSGAGKSTLAMALADRGCRLMADDAVMLEETGHGWELWPMHAGVRLWPDSAEMASAAFTRVGHPPKHADKERLLAASPAGWSGVPARVAAMYFIGGDDEAVAIARASGADCLDAALRCCYLIDPTDREHVRGHFQRLGRLIADVPFYRVSYPRDFDRLDEVADALIQHVRRVEPCCRRG